MWPRRLKPTVIHTDMFVNSIGPVNAINMSFQKILTCLLGRVPSESPSEDEEESSSSSRMPNSTSKPTGCMLYQRKKREEEGRRVLEQAKGSTTQGKPGDPCGVCREPRWWESGHAFYNGEFYCPMEQGCSGVTGRPPVPWTTACPLDHPVEHEEEEEGAGGRHRTATNGIESYDPRADRWVAVATDREEAPCGYHGIVVLHGSVYHVGGFDGVDFHNSMRRLDLATRRWHAAAPMHERRGSVCVAVVGGGFYAMGGHNGHRRLSGVERYLPDGNQRTRVASMCHAARQGFAEWELCTTFLFRRRLPIPRPPCAPAPRVPQCECQNHGGADWRREVVLG
ncbi:hypothetical protein CRUP_021641 [Coryphaenoides rupestris]|nr:hypothetical protein CRUP_021641 [Coryphaenoides rupestris]